ncbi:hypothetical protein RRG08_002489 [Elysia crispata]|uniref:Uncharacterized protein n=1 Tax=Elysia crispata TaxID=231223 RepID=A0AAE1A7T7_9GAST|nr:hypothetical protein RRG08_002489 [Elysia crispata]
MESRIRFVRSGRNDFVGANGLKSCACKHGRNTRLSIGLRPAQTLNMDDSLPSPGTGQKNSRSASLTCTSLPRPLAPARSLRDLTFFMDTQCPIIPSST